MKNNLIILTALLIALSSNALAQSVGINTTGNAPDPSAMLDVDSQTKGLLIPRMTQATRNEIVSPAEGLMVFQTDGTAGYYYYQGGWKFVGAGLSFADISNKPTTLAGYGITDGVTKTYADGVINSYPRVLSLTGAINPISISSTWAFAGTTLFFALTKPTVVTANISAALGTSSDVSSNVFDYAVCIQNASTGTISPLIPGMWQHSNIPYRRTPFSVCATNTLPAGSYYIGFGVQNATAIIGSNDFLQGTVMLTNP